MKKLYEKNPLWFALGWIIVYCAVVSPLRGSFGDGSWILLLTHGALALGIAFFVLDAGLSAFFGWGKLRGSLRDYWYFIPLAVLASGNLWGGIEPEFRGAELIVSLASMLLVGFIEEMIFRGFLFRALLQRQSQRTAVIVSAVTFGVGHIVNLLAGQATLETLLQIVFAVAVGFLFTLLYLKSGCLWPCILTHGVVNAMAMLGKGGVWADAAYMLATIVLALVFCPVLARKPDGLHN